MGGIFRDLARQKECAILEGHLMSDHVYMHISIPPKYSVVQVLGFIKGKSAISIAMNLVAGKRILLVRIKQLRLFDLSPLGDPFFLPL